LEHFNGALLWITLSTIGRPGLEEIGWKLVEKLRLAFGETRPIRVALGHWFRSDEFVELNAFLLPVSYLDGRVFRTFGKDYFVHISHDEFRMVVTKTTAAHKEVIEQLKSSILNRHIPDVWQDSAVTTRLQRKMKVSPTALSP